MIKKVDLRKTYKELFHAQQHEFTLITVPHLQYITIDTVLEDMSSALMLLKAMNSALMELSAEMLRIEYIPSYLEGCCGDDLDMWTMMILQPSWIDRSLYNRAQQQLEANDINPEELKFQVFHEGTSVQTLHTGSWDEIPAIRNFIEDEWIIRQGYLPGASHHEIYLIEDLPLHPAEAEKYIIRRGVAKEKQ